MAKKTYDDKREEILSAALGIFLTRGFEGTTLEAVAESIGYTKPALYYYFRSKEELFTSLILSTLTDAKDRVAEIGARDESAGGKLRDLVRLYFDEHVQNRSYFSIIHMLNGFCEKLPQCSDRTDIEELSGAIPRMIMEIMRQGVESGEFRDEDPRVLGGIVFAMLAGVLIHLDTPILSGPSKDGIKTSLEEIIVKGIAP